MFPTQLGMAASWDPALVERVARATAVEVAATGLHCTPPRNRPPAHDASVDSRHVDHTPGASLAYRLAASTLE